jgi:hypothetical protein
MISRPSQADEEAYELRPRRDSIEVRAVDRGRPDLHEDLVGCWDRCPDIDEADDVG